MKNTTGKHLLAGPITVLDDGSYAGDASIDNLPPGQERLISYGVDLQMLVDATKNQAGQRDPERQDRQRRADVTRKHVFSQDYLAENKGEKDKTLIIEHPRCGRDGRWSNTDKPIETTQTLYRFKGTVAAGKSSKLTVQEQLVQSEEIAILPLDLGQLAVYQQNGRIPQQVRDALAKAIALKSAMTSTQREIQERQQRLGQITAEQGRMRENMKTVAQNSAYYTRLLTKLNDQETQIEKLQAEVDELQKTLETQAQGAGGLPERHHRGLMGHHRKKSFPYTINPPK